MFFRDFTSTRCNTLFKAIIVCNFKENKYTKIETMAKKLISSPILALLTKIWAPNFFVNFTSTRCQKLTNQPSVLVTPNFRKCQKTQFWTQFLAHLAQIRATIFLKNLTASVTRYHSQLSSCTITETNDPILRKRSDRWRDGRMDEGTDEQRDQSDFIGCCLTNKKLDGKKPSFGPNFGPIDQNLGSK